MMTARSFRHAGFTLVELIVVMVLMGIISATIVVFLRPAIEGYVDARRRADLTDIADTALRRMMQDVRLAVPNSINLVSDQCFQFVPTVGGGRYRIDADIVNDTGLPCTPSATCSAFPDPTKAVTASTTVDVLMLQGKAPAAGDYVVINNQNRDDVYGGTPASRYVVASTPAPSTPRTTDGTHRFVIGGNPATGGYTGGRFQVVNPAEPSVMYSCSGNKLYRTTLTTAKATTCETTGVLLATDVSACSFVYSSNPSATQSSGFITLNLTVSRNNEPVVLSYGVHVDNLP